VFQLSRVTIYPPKQKVNTFFKFFPSFFKKTSRKPQKLSGLYTFLSGCQDSSPYLSYKTPIIITRVNIKRGREVIPYSNRTPKTIITGAIIHMVIIIRQIVIITKKTIASKTN
jgi:hypothetical protein